MKAETLRGVAKRPDVAEARDVEPGEVIIRDAGDGEPMDAVVTRARSFRGVRTLRWESIPQPGRDRVAGKTETRDGAPVRLAGLDAYRRHAQIARHLAAIAYLQDLIHGLEDGSKSASDWDGGPNSDAGAAAAREGAPQELMWERAELAALLAATAGTRGGR